MEAASLRLQKEAKGYLDSLRGAWAAKVASGVVKSGTDASLQP